MSYLYAIKDTGTGYIKLGYSDCPRDRLRELQTGSSSLLQLIFYEFVDSSEVRDLEKILHHESNHLRVRGEWFNLTESQARNTIVHTIIRYSKT